MSLVSKAEQGGREGNSDRGITLEGNVRPVWEGGESVVAKKRDYFEFVSSLLWPLGTTPLFSFFSVSLKVMEYSQQKIECVPVLCCHFRNGHQMALVPPSEVWSLAH